MLVLAGVLSFGLGVGRADDPPDRLEKKTPPAVTQRPAPRPEKPADDKDKSKDDPAEDADKLREKIAEDMQSAEKKLKNRDPGDDTRQMQDRALRNIDKLIELARNPPPPPPQPPMDGTPPPMGGDKKPQDGQPQAGSQKKPQSGQARRERREQQRKQMEQQARAGQQTQPQAAGKQGGEQPGNSAEKPGMASSKSPRQPDQMSDVVKDIWGHLPETLRQEVDHYYRDRFMPRYRDLLQEYYQRLAERDRTRKEGR
jgi:hypothetical protein